MEEDYVKGGCQTNCVHAETVGAVREQMHSDDMLLDLSDVFKVLGDHTRVRILNALTFSELCVCDIASLLEMSSSAVSHQLRILRSAKIVRFRKDGKNVYYSLDDDHVFNLMREGVAHVQEG
jgi:DNA-binding transcriptional ArsR family regulator